MAPGTGLFYDYLSVPLNDKNVYDRQLELLLHYQFECRCAKCTADWKNVANSDDIVAPVQTMSYIIASIHF